MQKQAVVYLRQSHDHEGSGSLEIQEKDCRAECDRRGWSVAAVVVDNNVSGAVAPVDRAGMAEALAMLPRVDVLVAARLDRFSRVLEDCLALRRVCNAADVAITTADGQITEANAGMMFPLLGMVAEWERERTASRTAKGRQKVRSEGRVMSVAPYGYRIVRRNGGAYLDTDQAAAEDIREMAACVIAGMPVADIVYMLNHYDVPTPRDHAAIRAGRTSKRGRWSGHTVRTMLESPAVRGIRTRWDKSTRKPVERYRPDGSPDVIAPEILDVSTWHAVRRTLESRAQPRTQPAKTDSMLTGLLLCGVCGGRMSHSMGRIQGKPHRTYRCTRRSCVTIGADKTDAEVAARFLTNVGDARLRREVTPERRDVTAELADTERALEGLTAAIEAAPDSAAVLGARVAELNAKRETLQAERDAPRTPVFEDTGETFQDLWERRDSIGRRGLLSEAGVTVTVGKRTVRDKRVWDPERLHVDITDPDTVHLALELDSGADTPDSDPQGARIAFATDSE